MAFGRKPQDAAPVTGTVATRQPESQPPAPQPGSDGPLAIPDHLLDQVVKMVRQIPLKDDSASFGMLEKLLAADNWRDLNKPWEGTSGRELAGRRLLITDVGSRPSAFDAGPEIFLVVTSTDMTTGEEITWTTSALMVIVQLATAYVKGWLPIVAEVTAAAKPTARGFTPYHLTVQEIGAGR